MAKVADFVDDFERRARRGEHPRVRLRRPYVEPFLGELLRRGIGIAGDCLDEIPDPQLREIVKTILMSAAGGAILGAAIGTSVGGPKGAAIGAGVGAAIGAAAGVFACVVKLRQEAGPDGEPELVVEAAAA
jgi:hypothetical protein